MVLEGTRQTTGSVVQSAMKWYYHIGRQVWPYEIRNFLFRDRCRRHGPTLAQFWGPPENAESCDSPELPLAHPALHESRPASLS